MLDDTTISDSRDATRVSLKEDYEVRYWATRFACSEGQLRDAVTSVGNSVVAVEQYLKNRR